ncbi:bifunctional 4-hydroxy-2-oxoglutarate aldolase/2-dehydro-3-deoxy-phosphogluconate aldolase [Chryseomicrobium palamuruense]
MIEQMKTSPLIPVLRKLPEDKFLSVAEALINGGVKYLEITMDAEDAPKLIRMAKEHFGNRASVGAGTVMSVEQARAAIEAGAEYLISPALVEDVLTFAVEQGVPMIPGVYTPSEMVLAHTLGASGVKLFPAASLGSGFVKDVRGPLGHIPIIVTGGITVDTAVSYLDAGAVAVGAGSALLDKELIANGDWGGLSELTRTWVETLTR